MEEPGLGRAFLCLGCWLEGAHAGWLMLRFAQIGARRLLRLACRPTRFFSVASSGGESPLSGRR